MKRILLLAVCALGLSLGAQVKISEYTHGTVRCVKVENSYYSIVITPQIGGKILSFFDKISQTQLVRLKNFPSRPDQPIGHVGILDDRSDLVMANYECAVNADNPGRVSVTLTGFSPSTKVVVRKKLTFFDKSPVINVRYRYENRSKENITGFALGIRNVFYPSGDGVSADDRYFFPTTHTLRRLIGYTHKDESGEHMPDMAAKLDTQLGAPYHSFINLKKRSGLAFSFEDDFYAGYHIWKAGIKYPTYEWTYRFLPAGHRHDTEFNIIQVNGMDSVAFASPELLAGVKLEKPEKHQIKVTTDLKFLKQPPEKLNWIVSCRAVNWKWNSTPVNLPLKNLEAMKNATISAGFKVPGNGLYMVDQKLVSGRRVVAEWTEAVTFGKFNTLPVCKIKYRKTTESAAIPGWEAPQLPKMEVTAADKARGFTLFNELDKNAFTQCRSISMLLGRNEFESKEFTVYSLGYLGNINLELVNPGNFPAQLRVERIHAVKGGGARPINCKVLYADKNFELEESTDIWLTAGSLKGVKPGVYNLTLKLTGNNGRQLSIPVEIKVLDVTLPRRNAVNLEAEGYPTLFPGSADAKILNSWYANMREHGIDYFQFVGRMGGKFIGNARLDHYIDNALNSGLVIFKAARYNIAKPSAREKENWHKLGAYLRSKGFQNKDMFIKILDEQPVEKYPDMGRTGKWLKEAGFRPFSTFFNLFSKPASLKALGGVFEMFQGGYTTREEYQLRLKEGLLRPTDVYCYYTGSGTLWRSYEDMLFWGLQAAVLEHPLFHNHEYMRGGNRTSNIIWIGNNGLPNDSPAFEALRDGMEIAKFNALYRRYIKLFPENDKRKLAFEARYARLFGTDTSLFRIIRVKRMGVPGDAMAKVSTAEYRKGRAEFLTLLADMTAALGDRIKLASLTWNDLTIASPYCGVKLIGKTAEEKAAANLFKTLIDQTITSGAVNKDSVTVVFKIAPTDRSYMISCDGKTVTIQAPDSVKLEMGAKNWFNTFNLN